MPFVGDVREDTDERWTMCDCERLGNCDCDLAPQHARRADAQARGASNLSGMAAPSWTTPNSKWEQGSCLNASCEAPAPRTLPVPRPRCAHLSSAALRGLRSFAVSLNGQSCLLLTEREVVGRTVC